MNSCIKNLLCSFAIVFSSSIVAMYTLEEQGMFILDDDVEQQQEEEKPSPQEEEKSKQKELAVKPLAPEEKAKTPLSKESFSRNQRNCDDLGTDLRAAQQYAPYKSPKFNRAF